MNLLGSLYVARVAAIFLQQGQTKEDDKSLILLSSVAGFNPSTGIPVYQVYYHSFPCIEGWLTRDKATKHGVFGLMRCLSETLPKSAGIRANTLCPWFAETSMTAVFDKQWKRVKLPC
jgi:NAD(P)-dependent dehydrogenase (short-subunit alcohol dehydrogenase family)